jgi:hypothetical protein
MYISIHPSGVASRASWIQWATLTRDQQQFCTCLYLLQEKETGRPMLMEIKTHTTFVLIFFFWGVSAKVSEQHMRPVQKFG